MVWVVGRPSKPPITVKVRLLSSHEPKPLQTNNINESPEVCLVAFNPALGKGVWRLLGHAEVIVIRMSCEEKQLLEDVGNVFRELKRWAVHLQHGSWASKAGWVLHIFKSTKRCAFSIFGDPLFTSASYLPGQLLFSGPVASSRLRLFEVIPRHVMFFV